MKAGDTVTFMHDCFYHGGKLLHKAGDKVTIQTVDIETEKYSNLCPDILIPERIRGVLLVGFQGYYPPNSFYEYNIGVKVVKTNRKKGIEIFNKKKFKSGSYINTVKGVITHPKLGIPAYTFEEDDSYVECRRCRRLDDLNKFFN